MRGRVRGALTVGLWAAVAGFGTWALVRVPGLDRGYPVIQLIAFTPYAAALSVAVPLLAAGVRRVAVEPVGNTDHRAVFAELVLPPGGQARSNG